MYVLEKKGIISYYVREILSLSYIRLCRVFLCKFKKQLRKTNYLQVTTHQFHFSLQTGSLIKSAASKQSILLTRVDEINKL